MRSLAWHRTWGRKEIYKIQEKHTSERVMREEPVQVISPSSKVIYKCLVCDDHTGHKRYNRMC